MVEMVGWIALGISLLNLFVYIIWIRNNWKKSEIKLLLGFPEGELKKIKDFAFVELKTSVNITNTGNKDAFIESIWIHHNEKDLGEKSRSGIQIASNFKLSAHTNKSFDIKFSPNYKLEKEPSLHQGYDDIFAVARDSTGKKFVDTVYYKINKENKKIDSWFSYDTENKWRNLWRTKNKHDRR